MWARELATVSQAPMSETGLCQDHHDMTRVQPAVVSIIKMIFIFIYSYIIIIIFYSKHTRL